MGDFYQGRLLEIWSENNLFKLELIVTDKRFVFETNDLQMLSGIKRGDLVSIKTSKCKEIIQLKRLGGPANQPWSPVFDAMRWRRLTGKPSRMSYLWLRQKIAQIVRDDLFEQGFLEVDTPLNVKGSCPDTEIESTSVGQGYLVTSTEYQIKRLIVGGFEKVFTLTKNFRENDRGRYHSTEFTMLEWARAYGSLDEIEEDAVRFIKKAFRKLYPTESCLKYQGLEINIMTQPWEKITVRHAFRYYLGLDNLKDFSLEPLTQSAHKAGIEIPSQFLMDKHLVLSFLLEQLQKYLGKKTPTFLRDWPSYMTSSAKLNVSDPYTSERSELYISSIEVSDGFPFLTDAELQSRLFNRETERRNIENRKSIKIDQRYVEALAEGIPPGAGMALGFDRLVMILCGASNLAEVQAFSWEEL